MTNQLNLTRCGSLHLHSLYRQKDKACNNDPRAEIVSTGQHKPGVVNGVVNLGAINANGHAYRERSPLGEATVESWGSRWFAMLLR